MATFHYETKIQKLLFWKINNFGFLISIYDTKIREYLRKTYNSCDETLEIVTYSLRHD